MCPYSSSTASRYCFARRISRANRWNRAPTAAAKINDAGLGGGRREEESENSIELFLRGRAV